MSRRRKKNPLLTRIILISVAVHVIALPVLAHFGAFEKIQRAFASSTVVMLTPAMDDPKPKIPAKEAKKQVSQRAQKKGSAQATHSAPRPRSNVNQPPVVASGPGAGNGPAIDQGTGNAGEIPPVKPGSGNGGGPTSPATTPATTPVENPTPTPTPNVTPKPAVPAVKVKPKPVYREAEATYQPEPIIPDDLRQEALDKTCVLELTVGVDGSVSNARVATSCGIRDLDGIALRTARTWKFQPATADGEPVEGRVRLRIEFKVE